jgi:hypothetical protein
LSKKILFVSYFSGVDGNVMAEWADDRLRGFEVSGDFVHLVTGYGSNRIDARNSRVHKVPSISSDDFAHERQLRKKNKQHLSPFFSCIAYFLGPFVRWITSWVTYGGTGGKWSWITFATPVCCWLAFTQRFDVIYSTGGPPSAYIAGSIAGILTKTPHVVEFQDPLLGAKINTNSKKQKITMLVERFLVTHSKRAVYVTQKAAIDARQRYPVLGTKIVASYPYAWRFNITNKLRSSCGIGSTIRILHLGTLYGSRNLDRFFRVIDQLYQTGEIQPNEIQITNLGSIYTANRAEYLARKDFVLAPESARQAALERASEYDCLLLVQHDDERSTETIPYKIYDYLNLELPIFLLIRNSEISELCSSRNCIVADCGDNYSIKNALVDLVSKKKKFVRPSVIDKKSKLTNEQLIITRDCKILS